MYGSEARTLSKSDQNILGTWEIMRTIFGPVKEMVCGGSAPIKSS
jgi:hypothetical protein